MHKILLIEKNLQKDKKLSEYFKVYLCQNEKQAINYINKYNIKLVLIMVDNETNYKFLMDNKDDLEIFVIAVLGIDLKESVKKKILSSDIDDFLYEPIDYMELDFVVRKLLKDNSHKDLYINNIIIDHAEYQIRNDEMLIQLPPKEFQLLHLLFAYPERLFLKEELLNVIWWDKPDSDENTVRTHINRLRKKLKPFSSLEIETVQCIGYKGIIK